MASTNERIQKMEERRNGIVTFLMANEGTPMRRDILMKTFDAAGITIDRDINFLKKKYPENIKHKWHEGYFWKGTNKKPVKTESSTMIVYDNVSTEAVKEATDDVSTIDRYPDHKTDEGYSDPTAAAAMSSLPDRLFPKDIWTYRNSTGSIELWLVVAAVSNRMTGVRLYEGIGDVYDYELNEVVPITNKGETVYYFNPTRVQTKPAKYFLEKQGELAGILFNKVTASINLYLGLSRVDVKEVVVEKEVEKIVEVPVEVEKIVEKVVEVPVEKIVEVPVETNADSDGETLDEYTKTLFEALADKDVELALTKQRADIYEDICNKLLASN